jgi:uncharacterized protein
MDVRFLCDCSLGKLAKWLRILGYDTVCEKGSADQAFLRRAERERRIALTRKRGPGGGSEGLIILMADSVEGQIGEILETVILDPDSQSRMGRCLRCNAILEAVMKGEVKGAVPAYVYQNTKDFRKCPACGRIYWPGTHVKNAEEFLRRVL